MPLGAGWVGACVLVVQVKKGDVVQVHFDGARFVLSPVVNTTLISGLKYRCRIYILGRRHCKLPFQPGQSRAEHPMSLAHEIVWCVGDVKILPALR
jgi:hypothetical protein